MNAKTPLQKVNLPRSCHLYSCGRSQKRLEYKHFKIYSVQKEKNRSLDTLYQNCGSYLVEMRGIEPLSEKYLPRLSTSVVVVLKFPYSSTRQRVIRLGSF